MIENGSENNVDEEQDLQKEPMQMDTETMQEDSADEAQDQFDNQMFERY